MLVQRKGPSAASTRGVLLLWPQQHVSSERSCPRCLFTAPGAWEPAAAPSASITTSVQPRASR